MFIVSLKKTMNLFNNETCTTNAITSDRSTEQQSRALVKNIDLIKKEDISENNYCTIFPTID